MDFLETIASSFLDTDSFRDFVSIFSHVSRTSESDFRIGGIDVLGITYLKFKDEIILETRFDGESKMEENGYRDGGNHGVQKRWNHEGDLVVEGNFVNGAREGHWIYRYDNGVIADEGNYVNDREDGFWLSKDENGRKLTGRTFLNGKCNGTITTYNEDGSIQKQSEYINGKIVE